MIDQETKKFIQDEIVRMFGEAKLVNLKVSFDNIKLVPTEKVMVADEPGEATPVENLRAELRRVSMVKGSNDYAFEVLAKFGAKKAADVAPDKYDAVMAELGEVK